LREVNDENLGGQASEDGRKLIGSWKFPLNLAPVSPT